MPAEKDIKQLITRVIHLHTMLHALARMVQSNSDKLDILLAAVPGVDEKALNEASAAMKASSDALQAAIQQAGAALQE